MTNIGAQMRAWRKRNLLSQRDFALALGVVVRTIQGAEAGEHQPSYTVQRKFLALRERYDYSRRVSKMLPPKPAKV